MLDVQDLYVKYLLSPFSEYNAPIKSEAFDRKVRGLARRLL